LINQFKHHAQRQLGELLASRLGDLLQRQGSWENSVLLPVPLHWRGLLKRGYNQTDVIAQQLAKQLQIPVMQGLRKQLNTQHQQELNRQQRLRNSRELYAVTRDVSEADILLVDDVMTTGATLEAISAALKQAGAKRIQVCALARTPKYRGS